MKTVFNILLGLCACALIYVCYASIMGPINFEKQKKVRDKAVIARLIDIRKAQQEYRMQNKQQFTADFDTLIHFVKNAKIPFVAKEGVLSDAQLEAGLTERKAMNIISKAKRTNKWDEVKKNGLENFRRDTMWIAVVDTIYPKGFNPDSLRYIPYGNGAQFEIEAKNDTTKDTGAPVFMLEVRAPYDVYLKGLNEQEVTNLVDLDKQMRRFPGLKIGSLEVPNNNAGNWE